ncbi:MAG: hypothetical protein KGP14_13025 [Betaproteobacteria bacterium]|nr:hypothetical protein [Betaproteobacteria bacterium]
MKDEPELLVPISELHRQRAELLAHAKPPAPRELTGWRRALWLLWTILGAVTVLPLAVGALFIRRSDPELACGILIACGIWVTVAYWTNPLLRDGPQR